MKSLFMIYAVSTWPEHLSNIFHQQRPNKPTKNQKGDDEDNGLDIFVMEKYSNIAHAFCTRLCGVCAAATFAAR